MTTKVVVFDFDGTLTIDRKGSNCWVKVWEEIDALEIDDKLYHQFMNGEIDSKGWNSAIEYEFRKRKVNQNICENIAKKMKTIQGLNETFKYLYDRNIDIYILSGGIKQIIKAVLKNNLAYVKEIECQEFIYDENNIVKSIPLLEMDINNKSIFLNYIKEKYKIKGEEILFVGNSVNDEDAYKSGARTLCINPDKANFNNKNIWHNVIENCSDLREIIDFT